MSIWNRTEKRLRQNKELYNLYGFPDIITDIKIARLRWEDQVQITNGNENYGQYQWGEERLEAPDLDTWIVC